MIKIIVIFNFVKMYLFIITIPSMVKPLKYNTFMPAFFLILETKLKCAFGITNNSCFHFLKIMPTNKHHLDLCRDYWDHKYAAKMFPE